MRKRLQVGRNCLHPSAFILSNSHHNARRIQRAIGEAQGSDQAVAPAFGRTQIDEQNLVFIVLDDLPEHIPAAGEIGGRQLAFEDRILQMIAEVPHRFVDPAEAFVVADVVANKIGISHASPRRKEWGSSVTKEGSRTARPHNRPPAQFPVYRQGTKVQEFFEKSRRKEERSNNA